MEQLKVIIAGYDQYEGVRVNPSAEVVRMLAEQAAPESGADDDPLHGVDLRIRPVFMPISFGRAWPVLLEAIDDFDPRIVIATGLKRSARSIAMERCAVNLKDANRASGSSESAPAVRREAIDPEGPAAHWTRLPLRSILQAFARDNIPATLSSDAGTYVCNAVFYNLLNWTTAHPGVLAGFASLPPVPDPQVGQTDGLALDQQVRAGWDLVGETVRYYRRPSSSDMLIA
ncbi:pyroglutamyl-peptidase I [Bifidobacterium xylocopae]|uniref:Pyroglutamyl-peptidase I n=1 Tax=Bifidobacterium xylocopae TaxID=2493119 RepID=A0A366KDA3_9BIFI|nr:pyroglutamyl-peptidase I [Bifidobacterium xylocopae]RBP99357.1 peptidase C15 [Bifidobacterium xylocopae]